MNAIDVILAEIKKIPYEILHAGMTYGDDPKLSAMTSIEDKITRKVIKNRVLLACNVMGGIQTTVAIPQMQMVSSDRMYTAYYIPPELVMNKEIVSALHLSYLPGMGSLGGNMGYGSAGSISSLTDPALYTNNPLVNVAGRIGSAAAPTGIVTNAHMEIVAYNTIAVYAHFQTIGSFGITMMLENDNNFNNISPRYYLALARACELATKSYIWTKLVTPLNMGYLSGGQDLGIFRSIIEGYSTAEEEYQTYLTEILGKVLYQADTTRHNKLIRSMFSPDL